MKNKYVIGVDPDSEKHGIAVYCEGALQSLHMLNTVQIFTELVRGYTGAIFSIENCLANNFVYARNTNSKAVQSSIARRTGRCQQAQAELMLWLDHYQIPYVLHKPQKGNWAENKPVFEKATGWKGSSNKDTRSAAYFGFLALRK